MEELKKEKEESTENIVETLTSNECDHSAKLRAVRNLRKLFKPPDKIFSKLTLESVLQSARISFECKAPKKEFLYNYGTSLADFIGRNSKFDPELFYHLEYILAELKKVDENLTNVLVTNLWNRLEKEFVSHPDGILSTSKVTVERAVLNWVDTGNNFRMEFLSNASANSPKLFQTLTLVLFEVLVRTLGHRRVFEVTESFVRSVKFVCLKQNKNFLKLYPKDCRRLVSLLIVPPEVYSKERQYTITEVTSLLLKMYLADKKKALILLSHYSNWVSVFKVYLEDTQV